MNIFVTDESPKKSALALDDKRLIKMILESTQLLCTAINHNAGKQITAYKSTHINHPCSVWTRDNFKNWMWLYDHALHLAVEYTSRFNKEHKCERILYSLAYPLSYFEPSEETTAFPNCTTHKNVEDTIKAYRLYMIDKWNTDKRRPKWTNRTAPWWVDFNTKTGVFSLAPERIAVIND